VAVNLQLGIAHNPEKEFQVERPRTGLRLPQMENAPSSRKVKRMECRMDSIPRQMGNAHKDQKVHPVAGVLAEALVLGT